MKTISFQIEEGVLAKLDKEVTPAKNRSQLMREAIENLVENRAPIEVLLKQLLEKLNSMEVGNG